MHRFLIANFPKERRFFDFVIQRRLSREVRVTLDVPAALAKAFVAGLEMDYKLDKSRQRAQIVLPSAPYMRVPRVLLPADARLDCRITFKGVAKQARAGQSLSIAQVFEGEEVGRVTWRFERKRKAFKG